MSFNNTHNIDASNASGLSAVKKLLFDANRLDLADDGAITAATSWSESDASSCNSLLCTRSGDCNSINIVEVFDIVGRSLSKHARRAANKLESGDNEAITTVTSFTKSDAASFESSLNTLSGAIEVFLGSGRPPSKHAVREAIFAMEGAGFKMDPRAMIIFSFAPLNLKSFQTIVTFGLVTVKNTEGVDKLHTYPFTRPPKKNALEAAVVAMEEAGVNIPRGSILTIACAPLKSPSTGGLEWVKSGQVGSSVLPSNAVHAIQKGGFMVPDGTVLIYTFSPIL